jgi:rubrerythrin
MRGKIGTTQENLESAFQTEIMARDQEYPEMVEDAKEGSTAIKKAFRQSMDTDGEHADLYKNAMEELRIDSRDEYYVCQICGHISQNFAPENCPVCKAVTGRFKKIL